LFQNSRSTTHLDGFSDDAARLRLYECYLQLAGTHQEALHAVMATPVLQSFLEQCSASNDDVLIKMNVLQLVSTVRSKLQSWQRA